MNNSALYKHISYDKAYRKNRLNAANWVLENPETIKELLQYCFHEDQTLATKATWVLEFVFRKNIKELYPFLNYIFKNLSTAKSDGQLRSLGLFCEMITIAYYKEKEAGILKLLKPNHKKIITECCFDWMITNQKVACQARAMTALQFLGTEYDWIHPELQQIIIQNMSSGSAGYKARGKQTLAYIEKFNEQR
ncbi:hypothetical protein [Patiriisocius hiemis]|uniref:Adenylosuccinate lyase n=1 Tax=Patiriisocius hiemis TaxID=3075604 RepID=A0ABU2Y964_9FLAO|nr:hypothetical protein [Constantimarinum sp. W242]MDT0554721.1 hypothetical protein [Constantimarinum sp. W242]